MSTKYICDGCDVAFPQAELVAIDIALKGKDSQTDSMFGQQDLCSGCLTRFKSVANPRKWEREARS